MDNLFLFLKANNLTISSCESFTAGLFANEFCQIAGASNYYQGGFICYSNEFKIEQLNIPDGIIKKYDVVSPEVATLLAENCAKKLNTDICFAFTGYAPITSHPHAGLSYVAIYFKGQTTVIEINDQSITDRLTYQKHAINEALKIFETISKNNGKSS